jgi:hypothetical protein
MSSSQLSDIRITSDTMEFAAALERRYSQEIIEMEQAQRESLAERGQDDPDYMMNLHFNSGRYHSMQRCLEILEELLNAEAKDRNMRLGE